MNEHVKTGVDLAAAGTTIAVIAKCLPYVAALFTIVWTGIRIYETRTVQRLIARWSR